MPTFASGLDLTRAQLDPASTFETPDGVLRTVDLSAESKAEILCRWAYDASELAVAEEEGMGGGERSQLDEVLKALNVLTGGFDAERVAPTKHGGFCLFAKPVAYAGDARAKFASSPCMMHELDPETFGFPAGDDV